MSVMSETDALEALRDYMRGKRSGDVEVLDVHMERMLDQDMEEFIYVTLILNNPVPGLQTWPIEDTRVLHRLAYGEGRRLPIATRFSVHVGSLKTHGHHVREGG